MKNYQKWHTKKSRLENSQKHTLFREREIWWCSIWENIGYEQDGKNHAFERPVLIIKKFSNEVFLGIPMTSAQKDHPFYFSYQLKNTKGSFILSQARVLSKKRLQRKISSLGRWTFADIKEAFKKLIS